MSVSIDINEEVKNKIKIAAVTAYGNLDCDPVPAYVIYAIADAAVNAFKEHVISTLTETMNLDKEESEIFYHPV